MGPELKVWYSLAPSKNFGGDEKEEKENEKSKGGNSCAAALECVVFPSSQ